MAGYAGGYGTTTTCHRVGSIDSALRAWWLAGDDSRRPPIDLAGPRVSDQTGGRPVLRS